MSLAVRTSNDDSSWSVCSDNVKSMSKHNGLSNRRRSIALLKNNIMNGKLSYSKRVNVYDWPFLEQSKIISCPEMIGWSFYLHRDEHFEYNRWVICKAVDHDTIISYRSNWKCDLNVRYVDINTWMMRVLHGHFWHKHIDIITRYNHEATSISFHHLPPRKERKNIILHAVPRKTKQVPKKLVQVSACPYRPPSELIINRYGPLSLGYVTQKCTGKIQTSYRTGIDLHYNAETIESIV